MKLSDDNLDLNCVANRSWEIIMGESLSQESFELIGKISQLQKEIL